MTTHAGQGRGDGSWAALAAFAAVLVMLALVLILGAPPARSQGEGGGRFLGVASCAGSTSHGRLEGDGPIVRQDELRMWQEPSTPGGAHSSPSRVLPKPPRRILPPNPGTRH